jgi:hypothetical protein
MTQPKIILADSYQKRLGEIEDFIWHSSGKSLKAIEEFLTSHDLVLEFLKQNPTTPAFHPKTGDRSWPFSEGRYRLFFRCDPDKIVLLDLIDNRMSNLNVYPNNSIPTYDEE